MAFRSRGKYFRKLLLSAAILMILPSVAAIMIFAFQQTYQLRAQEISDYEKRIIHSTSAFDQQLTLITQIPAILSANDEIAELYEESFDPINSIDIVMLLNHYCQFNNAVYDIYVHVVPHSIVYSSRMRMPDVSDPIGIQIDGMDYRDARRSIDVMYSFTRNTISFPYQEKCERILYSAPIHTINNMASMSATIVLDDDIFYRSLAAPLETNGTVPLVGFSRSNEIIYCNVSDEILRSALFATDGTSFRANNIVYRVFSSASTLRGYQYVFALPEDALFSAHQLTDLLAGAIVLSTLFVAISLWLFLRANYTPIHNVYATVRKHLNQSGTDEIESIRDTIELLETHVENLTAQSTINRGAMQRAFLLDLMNGEWIGASETLLAQAEELDIPTSGRYSAILISCADISTFSQAIAPVQLFNAGVVESGYICCLCVCPLSTAASTAMNDEELRALLTSASEAMRSRFADAPGACVGNLYDNLSMLPFSYTEAKAATELQRITGKSILLYKDISIFIPDRNSTHAPTLHFTNLARCITQHDAKGIAQFMDSVVQLFENFEMPLVDMRRIVFEIYNAIFSVAPELSKKLISTRAIFDQHTRDEILDLLEVIRLTLLENENDQSTCAQQPRLNMDSIDAYIQTHYADHDFSIRTLAAQANLSLPYFSQLFKREKGVSPIDYVTEIRIRNAQKLLTGTNLSVAEIVNQIGYYSISSFVKRFRQYTGMTPSEFRNQ